MKRVIEVVIAIVTDDRVGAAGDQAVLAFPLHQRISPKDQTQDCYLPF